MVLGVDALSDVVVSYAHQLTKELHMNYYTLPGTIYQANDTDGVVEIEMTEAEWIDILISLNVQGEES